MSDTARLPSLRLAVAAVLVALAPGPAPAAPGPQAPDEDEITLVLEAGQRPLLRLAFPAFVRAGGLSGPLTPAADEVEETLRADLDTSGIFDIQGPADFVGREVGGGLGFDVYRSLGNEILLAGEIRGEGGELVLEARIFELESADQIVGKRYRGGPELARRIAHSFADEVVRYFTGRRGIALTRIAFYSDRDGFKELYLMDYDGRNQRRITGHRSLSLAPDWSPSGDALAYVSYFEGPAGVYRVELASGEKRPVLAGEGFHASPSHSADGERIVLTRSLEGGNTEIFTVRVDGSGLRRLTHASGIDTNPAWSPSGREIAFTSSRSGTPQIYLMDAEGANLRRLSFEGDYNDGAAWHLDGDRIAYASRRQGVFQIALTELVTGETRVLPLGPGSNEQPSFSPDGRRIAFTSDRSGSVQVYAADVDGRHLVQLTREGENRAPAWSGFPR